MKECQHVVSKLDFEYLIDNIVDWVESQNALLPKLLVFTWIPTVFTTC